MQRWGEKYYTNQKVEDKSWEFKHVLTFEGGKC